MALLAACGQAAAPADAGTPAADQPAPAVKATAQPTAKGRVELTYWRHVAFPLWTDFAAEYNESQEEYTVTESGIANDDGGGVYAKYTTALAAGTPPDITHNGVGDVQQFRVTGGTIALDSYFQTSSVIKPDDLWPTLRADATLASTGEMVSLPWGPDLRVVYVHRDIFLEQGLDPENPPKTWDALEDATQRTTIVNAGETERAGFPPFWGSGGNNLWLVPFWQLGGETTNEDLTTVTITTELAVQALEWLKKLNDMQGGFDAIGRLRETAIQSLSGANNTLFAHGKAAMYYATFAERGQYFKNNHPDFTFGFTPWPVPEGGRDANIGGDHMFIISAASQNQDGAWNFIEWASQGEINLRIAKILDRVPVRPDVTNSVEFTEGDPFRELIGQQMPFRRFIPPVPGGGKAYVATASTIPDMMSGKITIQEGLEQAQATAQAALDEWKNR